MTEILVQAASGEQVPPASRVVEHPAWAVLKNAVEQIRPWQAKDARRPTESTCAPECLIAKSSPTVLILREA